ncbi:MAG: amino acid permease [Candidatus Omnitrophica bacterium]|nr:amino acid permease [Candidatus Omnitrophota bacterium]
MPNKLKKELKLLDVYCIATGAMISSGLFILPGIAHSLAGPAVVVSYFLAGLLAMTGMLSQAELVSAMPKAGGTYFYVARSMGPVVATINGLLEWLSISLKSAFALVGISAFASFFLQVNTYIVAVFFCALFVVINYLGAKKAGRAQIVIVTMLLVLLVFYVVRGLPAINMRNFTPFIPFGVGVVFSTAGFVFISYGGLIKVTSIAEEVKDPGKVVPLGMMLSLITVVILYTLVIFVTSGVLGADKLDRSLTPISDGAFAFAGRPGQIALAFAAILAFISTANAGIMSAARYPLALSRDGLLPKIFGNISEKFKTPNVSIFATGVIIIVALFFKLKILVEVASTVLIFTFIFSSLCVIIMRESGIKNYKPTFNAPLYPWMQIAGILGCWLLVVSMGKEALFISSLLFAGGVAVFWFYGRQRTKRDFALLHLIEKVTAKEFIDVSLETELKEIIHERDEIVKDRFDRVIEESVVLDIKEALSSERLFGLISERIAKETGRESSVINRLLSEREQQGSTVLSPGLAIPHIVISGDKRFLVMLVRSKAGIVFPGADRLVRTVFVIAGTKDERKFHLRALSAIAQITQEPDFEKKWMNARDEEELRDIILLGKRKRQ